MAVLKYRDPATGNWVTLSGGRGGTGPTGPTGPTGEPGATYTPEQVDGRYLRLDGREPMEGDLDAGGNRVTGTAAATTDGEAVIVAQIAGAEQSPVQVADAEPEPRATGDLWIDTSAPVLEWDAAWIPLPLANGWTAYDVNHSEPGYRQLMGGLVELRGSIKHTTAGQTGAVAVMPAGYRAGAGGKAQFVVAANGGWAVLDVLPAGTVELSGYGAGNSGHVSLDGVTYQASA